MGGRASRLKGHNWEREVANILKPIFPDAKRGFQTRGGTSEEPDVEGTPFYIECKRMKRCNPIAALRQAEVALYKETDEGTIRVDDRAPLAVCKSDRQKATVTMYLDDFLPLIRSIYVK